ncbi:MAG: hypothetical protein VXZ72_04565 [Chlamydiota bacterium]|nr:hypothetical protein [Chlamydiota bacterium]
MRENVSHFGPCGLVLESSGKTAYVMVTRQNLLPHIISAPATQHALFDMIGALRCGSYFEWKDLLWIGVGKGPGRWTGTRIGVMAAKALSVGRGLPLMGFPSILWKLPEERGKFALTVRNRAHEEWALTGENREEGIVMNSLVWKKWESEDSRRKIEGGSFGEGIVIESPDQAFPLANWLWGEWESPRGVHHSTFSVDYGM